MPLGSRRQEGPRSSRPGASSRVRVTHASVENWDALRHILPGAAFIKNGASFAILFDMESEHVESFTLPDGKEIKRPAIYMARRWLKRCAGKIRPLNLPAWAAMPCWLPV